jgi:hypothetical protein
VWVLIAIALFAACGQGNPRQTPTTVTFASTTTTTRGVTAADAEAFVRDLMRAVNAGDDAFLVAHLDPLVIGLYGTDACATHIHASPHRSAVTVTSTEGPATYTFQADGVSLEVANVFTVRVDDTTTGKTVKGAVRVGTAGGVPRWFTDCGTLLPPNERRLPAFEVEG